MMMKYIYMKERDLVIQRSSGFDSLSEIYRGWSKSRGMERESDKK